MLHKGDDKESPAAVVKAKDSIYRFLLLWLEFHLIHLQGCYKNEKKGVVSIHSDNINSLLASFYYEMQIKEKEDEQKFLHLINLLHESWNSKAAKHCLGIINRFHSLWSPKAAEYRPEYTPKFIKFLNESNPVENGKLKAFPQHLLSIYIGTFLQDVRKLFASLKISVEAIDKLPFSQEENKKIQLNKLNFFETGMTSEEVIARIKWLKEQVEKKCEESPNFSKDILQFIAICEQFIKQKICSEQQAFSLLISKCNNFLGGNRSEIDRSSKAKPSENIMDAIRIDKLKEIITWADSGVLANESTAQYSHR